MILNITKENFAAEIEQSSRPVLVELWAPWCGYCQRLAPILDMLADKVGDTLPIGKINTDEQPELAERLQAELIPTLYVYQRGQHSEKLVAPTSLNQLEGWLKQQGVL